VIGPQVLLVCQTKNTCVSANPSDPNYPKVFIANFGQALLK